MHSSLVKLCHNLLLILRTNKSRKEKEKWTSMLENHLNTVITMTRLTASFLCEQCSGNSKGFSLQKCSSNEMLNKRLHIDS